MKPAPFARTAALSIALALTCATAALPAAAKSVAEWQTITSQANVLEYQITAFDGLPTCLAFGQDGALWITEQLTAQYANNNAKIGHLTPDGIYTT